jgi:hypothetical protein
VANWKRLRELSWAERGLLAQGLVLLPLMSLALWTLGLRRWQAALGRLAPARISTGKDEATLIGEGRATARLVDAAARHGPYRASCLPRSLTLLWLLRRRGIDGELRIGVRKVDGQFQAHAWVEYRGAVLNDRADVSQRFSSFDRVIAPAAVMG